MSKIETNKQTNKQKKPVASSRRRAEAVRILVGFLGAQNSNAETIMRIIRNKKTKAFSLSLPPSLSLLSFQNLLLPFEISIP